MALAGTLNVELNHAVPGPCPYEVFLRKPTDQENPGAKVEKFGVEVTIHNGRKGDLTLDESSFELVDCPTQLQTEEFYSDTAKIVSVYYDEMKELFTRVTGSSHVKIFHHQIRNQERVVSGVSKEGVNTSTPVQPYALNGIHSDSSSFHAESMFKMMVQSMPEECRTGRFLYINAWRNIADDPIMDNHLAVLDERTLVKPDDYIPVHLHGVGYDLIQYNLNARNARQHKWYYYPRMTKSEVLVFKQWDSDPSKAGRLCFHTAIKDPTAPDGIPARQSIETRAFVFFPDHLPNTCPLFPTFSGAKGEDCDENLLKSGSTSLLAALTYIDQSDSVRAMVLTHFKGKYETGGAKAVLAAFAEDEQGYHGLTKANMATKARVVEYLVSQGAIARVDAWFQGPSPVRLMLGQVVESRAVAAILGAAVAFGVSAALGRRRR